MKSRLYLTLVILLLYATFATYAQSAAPIGFDIRGRDCSGGLGLCSANKMSSPNNNISIQKTGENVFVLAINRSSLSGAEQTSIAGQPFSAFQANLPTSFTQTDDLIFDSEVVQALGLVPKYKLLKKGSYPMQIEENVVKITLTLAEVGKP
ncbi:MULTISPECIES: hypothetical protein [Aequorivita]|uniref:Uncharacterized protein n=2 Tax=Aequorivita TaxID=153265 RepID=A0AB35YQU4_9FLAO|nr:hypothetical protein [Aequorivita sp. Ant34-E75]WGF93202.1 hypothetical protein QCQ61_03215 [Aequorivita sp. Ant34-E75]|tara:strand:- start:388 stop:840 length:453 start_codon:yes stop_codon:yes gene_type:complete